MIPSPEEVLIKSGSIAKEFQTAHGIGWKKWKTGNDIDGLEVVYAKPKTLTRRPTHYCPGCGHGVVHKILMEIIEEMNIQEEQSALRRSDALSMRTII